MSLPLAGIVVVELGHSVAAPALGQILGDLGAEVVKVEKAGGDDARKWGPPFLDGQAATFQSINRNKRSVVCDLRDPAQRARLVDYIVQHADVVLQNLRPGQVDELGLGAAALVALKPSLVYCNVGAFGAKGPLADRPGYDPLMQAFGGIMSVVGEEGRPPVRVGPSIIDQGTAMWGAIGILAALYRRKESGKGGAVDVSLFETAAAWMAHVRGAVPRLGRAAAAPRLGRPRHRALPRLPHEGRRPGGGGGKRRTVQEALRGAGVPMVRGSAFQDQSGPGEECCGALRHDRKGNARNEATRSGPRCWMRPACPARRCRT